MNLEIGTPNLKICASVITKKAFPNLEPLSGYSQQLLAAVQTRVCETRDCTARPAIALRLDRVCIACATRSLRYRITATAIAPFAALLKVARA